MEPKNQKRLRKFWPRIADEVDLAILLPGLSCLLEPDRQTLSRKLDNEGNWKAIANHLPDCLRRRPKGYKELLEGMIAQDKAKLVREIDPTFPGLPAPDAPDQNIQPPAAAAIAQPPPGLPAPDAPDQNIQPPAAAAIAQPPPGHPPTYEESQVTAMMQQPPYVSNILQQQQWQHPPGANSNFSPAGQPMLNTVPMQVQSSTNPVAAPTNPANTGASNVHIVANNVPGSAPLQHRHYANPITAPTAAIYPLNTGTNRDYAAGDMNMQQQQHLLPNSSPAYGHTNPNPVSVQTQNPQHHTMQRSSQVSLVYDRQQNDQAETSTQTSLSQNTSQGVGTGNDARIIHINVRSDGGAQNIQIGQGNEFSAGNQSPGSVSNMSDENETLIEIVRGNADETGASAEGNSQSQKEQDLIDFDEPERDVLNAPSIMGNNSEGNDGNNTKVQDTRNSTSPMRENSTTTDSRHVADDATLTVVDPSSVDNIPQLPRIYLPAKPAPVLIPAPMDNVNLITNSNIYPSDYTDDSYNFTSAELRKAESSSLGGITTSGNPESDGNGKNPEDKEDPQTLEKQRVLPGHTNPAQNMLPATVDDIEVSGNMEDSLPQAQNPEHEVDLETLVKQHVPLAHTTPAPNRLPVWNNDMLPAWNRDMLPVTVDDFEVSANMEDSLPQGEGDQLSASFEVSNLSTSAPSNQLSASFEVSNLSTSAPSKDQQGQSGTNPSNTNIVSTTRAASDQSGDHSEALKYSLEYKFAPADFEMDCEGGAPEMELSDISPMQASGSNIKFNPEYVSGVTNSRSKAKGEDGEGHMNGEDIPQEVVQIGEGACKVRQRPAKKYSSEKSGNVGSNGDVDKIVIAGDENVSNKFKIIGILFLLLMIAIVMYYL